MTGLLKFRTAFINAVVESPAKALTSIFLLSNKDIVSVSPNKEALINAFSFLLLSAETVYQTRRRFDVQHIVACRACKELRGIRGRVADHDRHRGSRRRRAVPLRIGQELDVTRRTSHDHKEHEERNDLCTRKRSCQRGPRRTAAPPQERWRGP